MKTLFNTVIHQYSEPLWAKVFSVGMLALIMYGCISSYEKVKIFWTSDYITRIPLALGLMFFLYCIVRLMCDVTVITSQWVSLPDKLNFRNKVIRYEDIKDMSYTESGDIAFTTKSGFYFEVRVPPSKLNDLIIIVKAVGGNAAKVF